MTLDQEDIKAIADEVVKRLIPYLEGYCTSFNETYVHPANSPPGVRETGKQWAERVFREHQAKRAEQDRLDYEIRLASEKMPEELRPHPDQYKSTSRKKHVLKLVQDPSRWKEVPSLSKQWVNSRKTSKKEGA